MSDFKRTNFVQVQHFVMGNDFVSEPIWRNALYVRKTDSGHIVQYTDGTKEELHKGSKIRKAALDE